MMQNRIAQRKRAGNAWEGCEQGQEHKMDEARQVAMKEKKEKGELWQNQVAV